MSPVGPRPVPADVLAAFGLEPGAPLRRLGGGHIHLNVAAGRPGRRVVLQRLNDRVFLRPDVVARNGLRISAALRAAGRGAPEALLAAGCPVVRADGAWWRAWRYLEGTVARPRARRPAEARAAAFAFADYGVVLGALRPPPDVTLPAFHDLAGRLRRLETAAAADRLGRAGTVRGELAGVRRLGAAVLAGLPAALPGRVAHNDAKLANVRFPPAGATPVVVDYDTTMPGTRLADVGELLRSATVTAPEDHPRPEEVRVVPELVAAVADGYRSGGPALDPVEAAAVGWAGPWLAVENAGRFLADHLDGDRYFATTRPGQNLDRCRVQLEVARQLLELEADVRGLFGDGQPG